MPGVGFIIFPSGGNSNLVIEYEGQIRPVQTDSDGDPYVIDNNGNKVYLSGEKVPATQPTQVTGAFLTDYRDDQIALANGTPLSFTDVEQFQSPTCAFAATLSAVARTNFDLADNITLYRDYGVNNYVFGVRLFTPNAQGVYQPTWVNVPFDGQIYPTDLQSTDPSQYWPTLYQRAYLQICQETGANSASIGQAFLALTGQSYTYSTISSGNSSLASTFVADLKAGEPVVASTPAGNGALLNPDGTGLVQDHAYTVLGIDSGASGTFVTLRNPWAQDTGWEYFDANKDGLISPSEDATMRAGLDGLNDGIIRIPWATFTRDFSQYIAGHLSGPSLDTPQSLTPPKFTLAGLGTHTVTAGQTIALNLSAVAPGGGTISYYLDTSDSLFGGSPGTLNLHTGQYSWTVPNGETLGTYVVTAVAQVNPLDVASFTFPGERGEHPFRKWAASPATARRSVPATARSP